MEINQKLHTLRKKIQRKMITLYFRQIPQRNLSKTELAKQANLVDKNPQKAIEMLEEASSAGETEAVVEFGKSATRRMIFQNRSNGLKKLLKPGIPKLLDIWGFSFSWSGVDTDYEKAGNGLNQP